MSDLEQRYFPIWKLGYRSNPFRALTLDEWRRVAILPKELEQLIDYPPPLTQLLGEKGAGKTSILLALQEAFHERSIPACYEYIPVGKAGFDTTLVETRVFLLDEAQRLSSSSRLRLLSSHAATGSPDHVFLASHEDLHADADEFEIPIFTVDLHRHDRELVESMIERRLQFFQKKGREGIRPSQEALEYAIKTCSSDLRKLESLLYEAYQTWNHRDSISKDHIIAAMNQLDELSGASTNVF